jgi:uncharacterized protein (TIGR04222 family)
MTGPAFFGIYLLAFGASLGLLFGAYLVRVRHAKTDDVPSPYHLAFLASGAKQVLLVGLAELMATGRAHCSRDGRLTMDSGYRYPGRVQRAIGWLLKEPGTWSGRARRLRRDRAVRDIVDDLRTAGLVWTARSLLAWSPLMLLPIAIFATGIAREAATGWNVALFYLLFGSVAIAPFCLSYLWRRGAWPTPRGRALVVRSEAEQYQDRRSRSRARPISEIPLTAIAVFGTDAVGDEDLIRMINRPGVVLDYTGVTATMRGCSG